MMILIPQVQVQQSPAPAPAPASSSQQLATITIPLPTEPVPKNQLGIPQPAEPQYVQPLNPAQITLPPSVASALQNLNQKAKPSSASTMVVAAASPQPAEPQPVKQEQMQILKQVQIVDTAADGQQLQVAAGGALPSGLVAGTGGGHPQLFYVMVPGAAVQPYAVEGGAIRVSTGEGGTAQLVTLPPGAFQAAQIPGSSAQSFPAQYIIDASTHSGGAGTSGGRSGQI